MKDAIVIRDSLLANATRRIAFSDADEVRIFEHRIEMPFPAHGIFGSGVRPSGCSALAISVGGVVGMGSEKEMVWSHASRIVAVVTDDHSRRDGAEMQFPTQAVRANVLAVGEDFPVAAPSNVLEEPALIGFDDCCPETVFERPSVSALSHPDSIARNWSGGVLS